VRGLPKLEDEDHLCDFPLGRKVSVKQYSIEELGEVLNANVRYFFERLAGDEVVTGGFISGKVINYCLDLGKFEAGEGWFELERGF
jgi:hypothetical protein